MVSSIQNLVNTVHHVILEILFWYSSRGYRHPSTLLHHRNIPSGMTQETVHGPVCYKGEKTMGYLTPYFFFF